MWMDSRRLLFGGDIPSKDPPVEDRTTIRKVGISFIRCGTRGAALRGDVTIAKQIARSLNTIIRG